MISPRMIMLVWIAALGVASCCPEHASAQYRAESTNFVAFAADQQLAQQVAHEAERFRRELAVEWLGHELPNWRQKCPIRVQIARDAGGETSFAFTSPNGSEPIDWEMKIFGPPDRLLDAVLPHEVTHTIFASHFQRPLPRWADEGACTTVEHEIERQKNHRMLIEFLMNSRGIPFNRMFTLREYPHDILPLYAQGYSLAKYLILQKGKRHFVDYIGAGMASEQPGRETDCWDRVTEEFYGFENLSDLQISWLDWVKQGSPMAIAPRPEAIVANPTPIVAANTQVATTPPPARMPDSATGSRPAPHTVSGSWYLRQAQQGNSEPSGAAPQPTQYGAEPGMRPMVWR